jgi:hypothetical protein
MRTNLKQRDPSSCLAPTATLVRAARQRVENLCWEGAPASAVRVAEEQHAALRLRLLSGEDVTPLF